MRYLIIFLTLVLTACASTPRDYYSLSHVDNVKPFTTENTQLDGIQLNLGPVPQQYDRPQLVVQDSSISPKVYVLNDSLWVSPLQDQIQVALTNDVAHYLDVPDVKGVSGLENIKKINVRVVNFDMKLNQGAYIEANWSDRINDQDPKLCKGSVTVTGPSANVDDLVERQKTALRTLAALIALQEGIKDTKVFEKIVSYDLGCT